MLMARRGKSLLISFFLGLAALASLRPPSAIASGSDDGLEMKYMYYWDRNGVWNHTPAFDFFKKISTYLRLQYNQELDAVSGASRRLGYKDIGILGDHDKELDGMTGASKREIRHSEQAGLTYSNQGRVATGSFYFSDEPDYRSLSPSFSGSWDFNDRNTTLGGGAAFFFDDFHPFGAFKGQGGKRTIASYSATVAQVLTPLSLAGITVNAIRSSGYLGHMYNPVITAQGSVLEENLPREKNGFAISGQFIQGYRLADRLGSVRVEARHYRDSWDLVSNTADLQWYQHLTEGTWVRLRARGYRQSAAAFAKAAYAGDEAFRTADIRYFRFSTLTLGAKIASTFPESWGESAFLPDRWDIGYDHGVRDTKGERDGIHPLYHYQLFSPNEYYIQGTFMAGLGFDF
ncbi:MAG: hypothetical protein JWP91_1726 [Fibrobacteres bacterium]|nr:hypothetical protein [Fibrobacterota bacterium]